MNWNKVFGSKNHKFCFSISATWPIVQWYSVMSILLFVRELQQTETTESLQFNLMTHYFPQRMKGKDGLVSGRIGNHTIKPASEGDKS